MVVVIERDRWVGLEEKEKEEGEGGDLRCGRRRNMDARGNSNSMQTRTIQKHKRVS